MNIEKIKNLYEHENLSATDIRIRIATIHNNPLISQDEFSKRHSALQSLLRNLKTV
jgi:hypothetical protein